MSNIRSYKDLIVWQRSLQLAKEIYYLTKSFPKEEQFGLISQMRPAVVSILSNIAEGSGRGFAKEWRQFYSFAYGSVLELESQLILSRELKFAPGSSFQKSFELLEEVSKMLQAILKNLKTNKLAN